MHLPCHFGLDSRFDNEICQSLIIWNILDCYLKILYNYRPSRAPGILQRPITPARAHSIASRGIQRVRKRAYSTYFYAVSQLGQNSPNSPKAEVKMVQIWLVRAWFSKVVNTSVFIRIGDFKQLISHVGYEFQGHGRCCVTSRSQRQLPQKTPWKSTVFLRQLPLEARGGLNLFPGLNMLKIAQIRCLRGRRTFIPSRIISCSLCCTAWLGKDQILDHFSSAFDRHSRNSNPPFPRVLCFSRTLPGYP
jgi:hypothetical protein